MSEGQKAIKYMAMFLAGCLTICILAAIVNVAIGVLDAVIPDSTTTSVKNGKVIKRTGDYGDIKNLKIESSVYEVVIKEDKDVTGVRVEMQNIPSSYKITTNLDSKTLSAKEENWFSGIFGRHRDNKKSKITFYVPKEDKLDSLDIEMGVGSVSVSDIRMKELKIECGVGSLSCENVQADYADFDGGIGIVNCDEVDFSELDLSGGIGDIEIDGKLTGKSVISGGMGNVTLDVDGKKEDYNYKVEAGLGSIYIDGEKKGDTNSYNNSQSNLIDIEGGIGTIRVNFD